MSEAVLHALVDLSAALERAGVPPVSPYWRAEAERFYTHPTAKLLVECVGRGGDKSRSSVIMAIAEVLAGDFDVPPGERHYFTHVSENRDEAAKTLSVLEKYLRILRVPFDRTGDTIELRAMPRGFRVLACRIGAVSGWRCIGWTADECAKWSNEGADPSEEINASIRAMTVTHPNARGRMFSSPLGMTGHFHETWAAGTTDGQVAGHAPSWVANPSISEERTHALERDPRKHAREYEAIPQAGALSAFDAAQIDRAMRTEVPSDWSDDDCVVLLDPTAGSSDTYAFGIAGWRRQPGGTQSILQIKDIGGVAQAELKGWSSDRMVAAVAAAARRRNTTTVHSDQFERFALASSFARAGFSFVPHTWTAPLKERAVEHVRMWLRDGLIALPKHERLRHELLSFEEKISPSGALTFRGRQGGHDDFAMLVLLAALVDIEGGLHGSPSGKRLEGQGILDYYAHMYGGGAHGSSSALVVSAHPTEEIVELTSPRVAGSSTFTDSRGQFYAVEGGRIKARSSDLEHLQKAGFQIVTQ